MRSNRYARLGAAAAAAVAMLMAGMQTAGAQSMEERLRGQLRTTTQQLRQLQDGQAQLEADKTGAEQARDKALAQVKELQAQLSAAKGDSGAEAAARRALADERAAHARDTQALAKARASYEELAGTARTRDAQRGTLQADLAARDTQLQSCQAHNADLYRVGHEILDAYEHVGLGTVLASRQPFAQSARVKYDQLAQRYGDALYAGKYDPAARPAKPEAASGAQ
ncbi:hypothetical protein [Burkholderia sp. Cy-637]|uniref:hypothetical protein n=1 Tax=Burkholderia sp. Cy-637 TaxID=2608327 RepID=UPI001F03CA6E|nr:hypothetical protein [Burkholderia sp. Cy-637]